MSLFTNHETCEVCGRMATVLLTTPECKKVTNQFCELHLEWIW